ncbi:glucosaminidase domain-containing protein [Compostibacter hankyongensis]|uniref:Glucosaminidase domain-containing protein n=1 Tax=Compostibacter hankyongensis TaxID=1007089 RepID=A0ABP8FIA1_9BACT
MKFFAIVCGIAVLLLGGQGVTHAQQQRFTPKSYIREHAPIAQSLMEKSGIPASVILGIAMLESANGNSRNAHLLNNHFGIVGPNHLDEKNTTYRSRYKGYTSDEASYQDFCKKIQKKNIYRQLKGKSDYLSWIKGLYSFGYAEAGVVWMQRVLRTIRTYDLDQFDQAADEDEDGMPGDVTAK